MPNVKGLAGMLDGGPQDDQREKEDKELLDDGETTAADAEGDEEWGEEDEGGEQGVGKKAKEAAKEADTEADTEKETKEEEEQAAEETEEETKQETKAVTEADEEKVDEKTRYQTIPYQRFRKELTKRHALAADLAAAQAEMAALKARMEQFEGAARKAGDPEPDAQVDPLGHTQWELRQLKAEMEARKTTQTAPVLPTPVSRALLSAYQESATAFAEEHKDFTDAYQFAMNAATRIIQAEAPGASPDEITSIRNQRELQEVQAALARGEDPAERVYQFAKQNGYKAKEAAVDEDKSKLRDKVVSAAAEQSRRKRAGSLATAGTTANRRPLTIDDVDGMSNEELLKYMDRASGRKNPLAP